MPIELAEEARAEAIASIKMYSAANFDEPLGNLAAASLLDYIVEEIGPSIYNRAVADVQKRMQARVMELDMDAHEPEFAYTRRMGWARRGR